MANYIGKETYIEVNGKKYRLSRFTQSIGEAFLSWADKRLGNPLDKIKGTLAGFPPEVQKILATRAYEEASKPRTLSSDDVQSLLQTYEGGLKLIGLLLQRYNPELTDSQVKDVYESCSEEHGEDYLAGKIKEASGIVPKDDKEREKEALIERGALEPERSFRR